MITRRQVRRPLLVVRSSFQKKRVRDVVIFENQHLYENNVSAMMVYVHCRETIGFVRDR